MKLRLYSDLYRLNRHLARTNAILRRLEQQARVRKELFTLAQKVVRESGHEDVLSSGIVLTGGSSLLPGIAELAGYDVPTSLELEDREMRRGAVWRLS